MNALEYALANRRRFLDELIDFLTIPSISAQAHHLADLHNAAAWLQAQLIAAGLPRAEILTTGGHPVVYAEWLSAPVGAPTILIYGHYDVQPADPLELWHTPPFEPTVIGDDLYARGASDDKGQLYIHIKAIEALAKTAGTPPVNLKCLFEGEEEIGSPHLEAFVRENAGLLTADAAVISDTHMLGKELPSIVYALRGLSYIEVEVTGPDHDLHSGVFGGAVHNPINVLCSLIAALQDKHGHITIPGFYDRVREPSPEERAEMARVPFDRETWLRQAGVRLDWGEPDYSVLERTRARPSLDVNGIWGGYTQPGAKTVLPSKAWAKISARLVPDQQPEEIARLIGDHLKRLAPPTVQVDVHDFRGGEPAVVRRDSPAMVAAIGAYKGAFGVEPVLVREGGSIPVVATFQNLLGMETVLMGFGLPDDRPHSPNEKLHLPNFYRGIETVLRFLALL